MTIQKYFPSRSLPLKVEAHETTLSNAKSEIQKYVKLSDGLIFKFIGLDAMLGVIPVIGGLYTAGMGLWLFFQCNRVKTSLQEKILTILLTVADVGVGIVLGVGDIGDAFFRIHAWTGNRLIAHINTQLQLIEKTREGLAQNLPVDIEELEDILFRGGKTRQEQQRQYLIAAALVILMFGGCMMFN